MNKGSTDLYFYLDTATLTDTSTARNVDSATVGLGDAGGHPDTVLGVDVSTFKIGDNGRFIAEFVIVARD